jgi:NAD-dependent SIR2 family protein deacetylase
VHDYRNEVKDEMESPIFCEISEWLHYIQEKNNSMRANKKVQTMMITSSIDGHQVKAHNLYNLESPVHQIDGSINRMHCSKGCTKQLVSADEAFESLPEGQNFSLNFYVPKCSECGQNMRPNVRYRHEADS